MRLIYFLFAFAQLAQRSKSLANAKMELATTKQQNQAMEEQVCEQDFVIQFSLSWVIWFVFKSRAKFVLHDEYMILPYTISLGPTAHLEGWRTFPIRRSLFSCMLRHFPFLLSSLPYS